MRPLLLAILLCATGCRSLGFGPPASDGGKARSPMCLVSGTQCASNDDCCSGRCNGPGGASGPARCQ